MTKKDTTAIWLYNQTKLYGLCGSIAYAARVCSVEIERQIHKNDEEIKLIQGYFNFFTHKGLPIAKLQSAMQTINSLITWLEDKIDPLPGARFIKEQLTLMMELCDEQIALIKSES